MGSQAILKGGTLSRIASKTLLLAALSMGCHTHIYARLLEMGSSSGIDRRRATSAASACSLSAHASAWHVGNLTGRSASIDTKTPVLYREMGTVRYS